MSNLLSVLDLNKSLEDLADEALLLYNEIKDIKAKFLVEKESALKLITDKLERELVMMGKKTLQGKLGKVTLVERKTPKVDIDALLLEKGIALTEKDAFTKVNVTEFIKVSPIKQLK